MELMIGVVVVILIILIGNFKYNQRVKKMQAMPVIEFDQLKTGDIVLTRFDSRLQANYLGHIVYGLGSYAMSGEVFSHAAMIYRDDRGIFVVQTHTFPYYDYIREEYIAGKPTLIEAKNYFETYRGDIFIMPANVDIPADLIMDYLRLPHEKTKTSMAALAGMAFGIAPGKKSLVCTRPVVEILHLAGIGRDLDADKTMPGALYRRLMRGGEYDDVRHLSNYFSRNTNGAYLRVVVPAADK